MGLYKIHESCKIGLLVTPCIGQMTATYPNLRNMIRYITCKNFDWLIHAMTRSLTETNLSQSDILKSPVQ